MNQAIIRSQTREELFSQVCRIAVFSGHFKVAWVAWLDTASNLLTPTAKAGDEAGVITAEFVNHCQCGLPVIQSGLPYVVHDLATVPRPAGYVNLSEILGIAAVAAYPIRMQNQLCGVLTVGTIEASMHDAEAGFLEDVTLNISFALDKFAAEDRRRAAEDALNEGEQLLNSVLHSGLDGFYLVDRQGRLLQVNDAYCAMSGYTCEELLRMHVWDLECAESAEGVAEHTRKIILQGTDRFESCHRRKDGQIINVESSVGFQELDGGRFFCFLRDITESKRAEMALRESEERFRLVVEGAPVGILIQVDGVFRYLNPAALAMFGAETADQIVGHPVAERIHPQNRAAVNERIRLLKEQETILPFLEEQLFRMDGTVFVVEATAIRFMFEGRGGSIVFIHDITERKRAEHEMCALEQQFLQSQKMEAVGRLAGGVAHDFNNLLMVIQSYTEMLQDRLSIHDSLRNNTEQILKAADRAASLTRQLLAFSRKQVLSLTVLDLNAVVSESAKMLKRLIGEDVELRVHLAESLWAVKADFDHFSQVLMNLCVNARDAMLHGGTLTIETRNSTIGERLLDKRSDVTPGDYVLLSVTDTGAGISKDVQEQIFEPFFTTKERGKGTGLGLSTVFGIVNQSGGHVWVDSEPGKGACFTVCLPRVRDAMIVAAPAHTEGVPRGAETLLVVEDEEALREAVCDFLGSLGYRLLAAHSGRQALAVARQHEGVIDILITDVVLPGMGGRELSQTLTGLRPNLKTIYMSGYTDDAVLQHGVRGEGVTLLQKPFSLVTLARKVREMLGSTELSR
jgi:PAS domain S-box-containing protein